MATNNNFRSLLPNYKESYSKQMQSSNLPMMNQEPSKVRQLQPTDMIKKRFNLMRQFLKPVKY